MNNILFVCKYNRFRSKIAESLFNKYNNNKVICSSAGIIQGRYPLDKTQVKVARKKGIIIKGKPRGINTNLLMWQDTIIIVANDVPKSIFNNEEYGKKLVVWNIPDSKTDNPEEIENIIDQINNKIVTLLREIK